MRNTRSLCHRHREHGFTIIELGIVIAVVAILATVVLAGRGFVLAARTSKAVESVGVVLRAARVYAGNTGGAFPGTASTALLNALRDREMLSGGNGWSPVAEWTFNGARHDSGGTEFLLDVTCPTARHCTDMWNNVSTNERVSLITDGRTINGLACADAPTSRRLRICFGL